MERAGIKAEKRLKVANFTQIFGVVKQTQL